MAEHLEAIAAARVAWLQSLSEEQRAAVRADKEASNDEAVKAERMAEGQATFQTADTNNDGLLDKAEFKNFMEMMAQNAGARGVPHMNPADCDEELQEKIYAFFDAEDGNAGNGVSLADVVSCMGKIGAKCRELSGN